MEIPQIGFGTYRLHKKTTDSVSYALKSGYRHIDTAPLYKNEAEVGAALNRCGIERKQIFVTTKISRNELKTNSIEESIKNSFEKLNLDYIDLLLLHEPIDFENNWQLLCDYYETKGKGKIRNIGVSNFNEIQIEKICSKKAPYCNQIELNPFLHRDKIIEKCKEKNIRIVAHSPLAKGEKMDDKTLIKVSQKYSITPAQAMLNWNYEQGNIVIPRSSDNNHIEDNLDLNFQTQQSIFEELNNLDQQYSTHPKYLKY